MVAAVAVEALERRSTEVEGPPGPQPMSRTAGQGTGPKGRILVPPPLLSEGGGINSERV